MHTVVVTRARKLIGTIVLFAAAVVIVVVAGTVHDVGPLFLVWIPLLAVPWLLTRPEPGDPVPPGPEGSAQQETEPAEPGDGPEAPRS
jgi:hypothetical protein